MGGPIISGTESARTLVTKNKIGYGYEKKKIMGRKKLLHTYEWL